MTEETKGAIVIEDGWQAVTSAEDLFLKDLPQGVTLLPKNWEGDTTRAELKFGVSRQAIENERFDLQGFIKKKFNIALTAIRNRKGVKELRLAQKIRMVVNQYSSHKKTHILIFIAYEQETNKDHDSRPQPKDVLQEGADCITCQ